MRKKDSDTKTAVIITVLIMLVIGLVLFIVMDKLETKETTKKEETSEKTNSTTEETTNKETTENKQETTTPTTTTPTEKEIHQLMINYIKEKNPNMVEYRINSISLDNNTKEFKEMININQDDVAAYIEYDLILDGNGYKKEDGWIKSKQQHCILTKDSNGAYYVQKCGTGW